MHVNCIIKAYIPLSSGFRVTVLVCSKFVGWYITQIHFCIVVPDKGWSFGYIIR